MQGAKSEHRYDCPNSYFFRTLGGRRGQRRGFVRIDVEDQVKTGEFDQRTNLRGQANSAKLPPRPRAAVIAVTITPKPVESMNFTADMSSSKRSLPSLTALFRSARSLSAAAASKRGGIRTTSAP
jgi:hypothetical protein